MSLLNRIVKNSVIYSISPLSTKLVGFILLPIYTSYFSVSDYGVLGILEVTSLVLISILGFGLYWAFNRWYWDKQYSNEQKSIFFTILSFLVFTSALFLALLFVSAEFISEFLFDNKEYSFLFKLMSAAAMFEIIGRIPLTLLKLQEKPGLYSLFNIIKLITNLFLTIYFIVYLEKGLEGIYLAQVIGGTVFIISLSGYTYKNIEFRLNLKLLKEMLVFSLPLVVASISGIILSITDRYSLKFMSDLSSVGLYALGYKVANSIKVFIVNSVHLALSPIIYKKMNDSDNKEFYKKILTNFSFGVMLFVLLVSAFGKEGIQLIAKDPTYWDSYKTIRIIAFSIRFGMMKDVVAIGIHLTKKTKIMAGIVTIVSILNILLNITLIPLFGITGAAYATLTSQIVYFFIVYHSAQKYYSIPYDLNKIIKMFLVSIAIVITAFYANYLALSFRIIVKGVLILSFPIVLYSIKYFDESLTNKVKEYWQVSILKNK